ncbi:hypothetical protein TeGR_g6959, partial [Tetraparma gracilis]
APEPDLSPPPAPPPPAPPAPPPYFAPDQPPYHSPPSYDLPLPPPPKSGPALLDSVFGLPHAQASALLLPSSPYSHLPSRSLRSFVVKAGDDVRLESLAMLAIQHMHSLLAGVPAGPLLHPYAIACAGHGKGVVEVVEDAASVDEVKKLSGIPSLPDFFERAFGQGGAERGNFLRSLVGYSLVSYVLQVKDRHNGNILLKRDGSICHIDFGFVFGDAPRMGKVPIFSERAPMKLTQEYWDVIGGWAGGGAEFCKLFEEGFEVCSAHKEEIALIVEQGIKVIYSERGRQYSELKAKKVGDGIRNRLTGGGPAGSPERREFIKNLIDFALNDWSSSNYDLLQKYMNGYAT